MKFDDVLEKHVYNIDFNDVRDCEFDGKHLGIVVKKNNDNKTVIVVPLTTSPNGDGANKINIGKINSLPDNLKKDDSYAVYNQVRTVNCSRFYALKDDDRDRINVKIDDDIYNQVISLCIGELITNHTLEEKLKYFYDCYSKVLLEILVNTAYNIKRVTKEKNVDRTQLAALKTKISCLLNQNIEYNKLISKTDIDNGVVDIIESCLKK